MPRVAFYTLGCKVNQYETETLTGLFTAAGYETVDFAQQAEVYVINTCSVTHLGESKSRQFIRRAARLNPAAVIVVTGCYAQVSPAELVALPEVSVLIGTQERGQIVQLVEEAQLSRRQINTVTDISTAKNFEDLFLRDAPGRTRAFLKIQEGCSNFCTYCIIPYARGPLRSRPLASIKAEARHLLAQGFREIVLTGIHLGAYGQDLAEYESSNESMLAVVVRELLSLPALARLRLGSIESLELPAEILTMMQNDARLCAHLHLPLQAGDDEILRAMHRHYTSAEFTSLVAAIRERMPDIAITTDVIVGFPGESEDQFANTQRLLTELQFAGMHIFPYSRRHGTPAATYPQQVAEKEKKRRVAILQALAAEQQQAFMRRFLGQTVEVLWESGGETANGLTGSYIRVYAANSTIQPGMLKQVFLEKLYADGLWGTMVAE